MERYLDWRALAVIGLATVLIGGIDAKTRNALKVKSLLKAIEIAQSISYPKERTAQIVERELNDYIGYRLAQEKSLIICSLKVDLLGNNHVQGKLKLDAEQQKLSVLLGPKMEFHFKGIVFTQSGRGRIELTGLNLNGQTVTPQVLNLVIETVAKANGTKPNRIGDWYDLPEGIKRISVHKKRAILYY